MIRINIKKQDLENFIDSLESDYDRMTKKQITFQEFRAIFCNDKFDFCNDKFDFCSDNTNLYLYKEIYKKISSSSNNFYRKVREFIIEKFTQNMRFCPYCGKSPLIYFDENNEKKRLFQFDHFFPKNIYHKGTINFYNLIPSCNSCNHLKGEDNPLDIILDGGVIFHPYFGNLYFDSGKLERDFSKNADIRLNYISKNSKFFKVGQKYLNSEDTFNTFNFIQDKRIKILEEKMRFKKSSKSDKQFRDYFFKNYAPQNEDEILKYSNGKLKKDLIDNLKL